MWSRWSLNIIQSGSAQSTVVGLGEKVELSNTRSAYVLHIFNTLRLILARKNPIENSINVSLWSTSFKQCFCRSSFSRRPSCYAQWEVRSAKLENHLKFVPQRKCEINKATKLKPTKRTLILYTRCSFSFPLPWQRIVKVNWWVINKMYVVNSLVALITMIN